MPLPEMPTGMPPEMPPQQAMNNMPGMPMGQQAAQMPTQPMDPAMMGNNMGFMPPMEMGPQKLFDIKFKRCIESGQLKAACIPPEDFLIDPNATRVDEDEGCFYADIVRLTRSDARLRWPDKDDVIDKLPAYTTASEQGMEKQARDNRFWSFREVPADPATEQVEIYECYIKVDYDGDGIAEWRQVCKGANGGEEPELLSNEEWAGPLPYVSVTPNPMPHRYRGRSLYDDVGDVQRVKTVLLRQLLDNTYLADNPMLAANAQAIENKDALLNPEVGGVVWTNGEPGNQIMPIAIPYIGDKIFPSLEYWDMVLEKRTGVSRSTMALDLDTLQHQTATAVNAQQGAAFTKVETYARNISECGGFKELFSKLLRLFVQNQKSVKHIQVRGKFVPMDPRGWNADMRVTINVGLGAGSRDRDAAALGGIAQKQEMVIEKFQDPYNPYCNIGNLFDTYRRLAETVGLKSPETYFPEITQQQVAQISQQAQKSKQPPPEVMKIQADMQIAQMQEQGKAQGDQRRAQLDQMSMQQKAGIEKLQAEADIATNQQKIQMEAARAERQFQFDTQMKREEHQLNAQLKREEHAMKLQQLQEAHSVKMAELQAQSAQRERDAQIRMAEREHQAEFAPKETNGG